jgi:peroxiredoxin
VLRSSVRIGQPPPNFLFEYAPGHELTLRKLVGRPFTIIFWKSVSRPSIETVNELQRITGRSGREGSVVLAINDGEAVEVAKQAAVENGLSATAVYDPRREISTAYGVNIWPTIIFVDALGLVRTIRYGRFAGPRDSAPAPSQRTPAQRE